MATQGGGGNNPDMATEGGVNNPDMATQESSCARAGHLVVPELAGQFCQSRPVSCARAGWSVVPEPAGQLCARAGR